MTDAAARLQSALADRYAIERELGQGGMATVYLAEDLRHQRKVALKVLRPDLAATLGPERFLREIKIAANLQHPNILPVHDSGEAAGFLYYVMPFVEGHSLRERLAKEGELPVPEAARILRDVADALSAAHEKGVVHRDIKPENVLLTGRHALVADFGVAKAVSEATGRQALTTAGVALGTPTYMAPEQAAASPHIDARADIYALGVMAYEMLTGQPPFSAATPQALLAAHVTEPPVEVTQRRAMIPGPLAQLIMRCLAKKAADRPQTADELLPVLESFTTPSGGITPTQTEPVRGVARWLPRRRQWAVLTATVVVLAVAVVVVAVRRATHRPVAASGAEAERSVAVLAFRLLSGDTADAFLPAGLAEDIATTLGQVRLIAVKAPAAVTRAQAATPSDAAAIGRALQVRYVLDGSVRHVRDSLRVSARLVEAATETQVWAATYDRAARELVRVPTDVARELAVWLAGTLQPAEQRALEKRPTQNPDAYEAYLRGNVKFLLRQRDANLSGIADYRRALDWDPGFAAARARISLMEAQQDDYRWYPPGTDRAAFLAVALSRGDSVTESDPAIPDGWMARCYLLFEMRRYPDALGACDRAVELNPRDLEAHNRRGWVLFNLGRDSAAATEAARLREIDPSWHITYYLPGRLAFQSGKLSEARDRFEDVVRLAPGYASGHFFRGRVRLLLGDTSGARDDLERIEASGSFDYSPASLRALLQAATGHADSARALAARLENGWPTEAAAVYVALRDPTRAIRVLQSSEPVWAELRVPEFDPLRADPRFQRIIAQARARSTGR